jgi:DNA repair protein RadD
MLELFDYQKKQNDAIRLSAQHGHRRIISCMSTGSGKSVMLADLTLSALAKLRRVIIVLPRRSLVNQLSRSFVEWDINHGIVMNGHSRFTQPAVQIVSIDTYMSRFNAGRMDLIGADVLIIDELQLQFSAKKLEMFKNYKMVVGFSATPMAPKKQALSLFYDDIVETISMQELMDQGYLSPLRYYAAPAPDMSKVKLDADGDYMESQLDGIMNKPKLVGDVLKNWLRITEGNKPTVIFCSSRDHALALTHEFNSHGYKFEYIDCQTSDGNREIIFNKIATGEALGICNFSIVGVGIDIPNLEVCVLARPTKLISVYLQCVGRVTRRCDGKTEGIVIDHAGIIENIGLPTDKFDWTLDGDDESIEERALKEKQENKEPKEIICPACHYVYKQRHTCPKCGYEAIALGKPLPVHQAELVEVKHKPIDKARWYSELLGYSRRHGKSDSYALALFKQKFNEWPYNKLAIRPTEPSQEIIGYVKHCQIAYAKRRAR